MGSPLSCGRLAPPGQQAGTSARLSMSRAAGARRGVRQSLQNSCTQAVQHSCFRAIHACNIQCPHAASALLHGSFETLVGPATKNVPCPFMM